MDRAFGTGLSFLVIALCASALYWSIPAAGSLYSTDATVYADGQDHTLQLPANTSRAIFRKTSDPDVEAGCTLRHKNGEAIELRRPFAWIETNDWTALAVFDTGDGTVVISCKPERRAFMDTMNVRIARLSSLWKSLLGVAVTMVAGFVGILGFGMLTSLFVTDES